MGAALKRAEAVPVDGVTSAENELQRAQVKLVEAREVVEAELLRWEPPSRDRRHIGGLIPVSREIVAMPGHKLDTRVADAHAAFAKEHVAQEAVHIAQRALDDANKAALNEALGDGRAMLKDAIGAVTAAKAKAAKVSEALRRAQEARWDAVRIRDDAEAAVETAKAGETNHHVAEAMGEAEGPYVALADARAALQKATDTAAAKRAAHEALEAEKKRLDGEWAHDGIKRCEDMLKEAIGFVVGQAIGPMLDEAEKAQVNFAAKMAELSFLGRLKIPDGETKARMSAIHGCSPYKCEEIETVTAPVAAWIHALANDPDATIGNAS